MKCHECGDKFKSPIYIGNICPKCQVKLVSPKFLHPVVKAMAATA